MVWASCPKRVFCGINRLQISLCEAVTTFNSGAYRRKQVLDNTGLITSRNCITAFENENKKRIRDASRKILQKHKKCRLQLRYLQKGMKSSTFYIYIYIYMTINLHFTSRKNMDKKKHRRYNYTIARYQYTGKYLGV